MGLVLSDTDAKKFLLAGVVMRYSFCRLNSQSLRPPYGLTSSCSPGGRSTTQVRPSRSEACSGRICSRSRCARRSRKAPAFVCPRGPARCPSICALLDFREEPDPLAAAEQWMRTEMRVAIPLEDPALFRFALIRVGEDHTIWFQKYHHIIIDATGRRLLSARTASRYRALRLSVPLPALEAATPESLLEAERRYAASSDHEADRAYWLERFAHLPGPFSRSTGETRNASGPGVMHASRSR